MAYFSRLFIVLISVGTVSAFGEEVDFKSACEGDYQASPGYRQFSPVQQDLRACKGVVGESFCIEDKQEEFLANCVQQKKQLAEAKKLRQIHLQLPSDLGAEDGAREPSSVDPDPNLADDEGFKDY